MQKALDDIAIRMVVEGNKDLSQNVISCVFSARHCMEVIVPREYCITQPLM